jgi:hypothetical protein
LAIPHTLAMVAQVRGPKCAGFFGLQAFDKLSVIYHEISLEISQIPDFLQIQITDVIYHEIP